MKAIVAVDENWGIGKNGQLLCHISADLRYFKSVTMGHSVILGRKTLSTFPGGRPLRGRENWVLSTTMEEKIEGAEVFRSVEELLKRDTSEAFLIGGAQVYEQLLDHCDLVFVTKIQKSFDSDAFFPNLDEKSEWKLKEQGEKQEENGICFHFDIYERTKE